MIDRFVSGKILRRINRPVLPTVYLEPTESSEEDGDVLVERVVASHVPAKDRVGNFNEVELCISEQEAICEAKRCMRCDLDFTVSE